MESCCETNYKGKIAYFFRGSWYHNKKEMLPNGQVKYGRIGGFVSPKDAEESYYKFLNEFESQSRKYVLPLIDREILLSDYLIYWYEEIYSKKVASTSSMGVSYTIYKLIIPNLPYSIKLRITTSEYITELLQRIDKLGKTTANKSREILNLAFEEAISNKLITVNPTTNSEFFYRGKVDITILNKKELQQFLAVVKDGPWYLEILLGLFCGLRKGEIMGLKFSDFDIEKHTVKIQRQLASKYELEPNTFKIVSYDLEERDPKTQNSFRSLEIPQIIFDELEKRSILIEKYKNKYKDSYYDNDYISCQKNGLPHSMASLNGYLIKICKNHSIPKVTVHSLRHIYATILIEAGVELPIISAKLGHSSIHTTFDFYCSVMDEKAKITAFMNNTYSLEEV